MIQLDWTGHPELDEEGNFIDDFCMHCGRVLESTEEIDYLTCWQCGLKLSDGEIML